MSLQTVDSFLQQWNGRYLEFNHDQYKNQCMDEFWKYVQDVWGLDPTPYRGWGSAVNCFRNFETILLHTTGMNKITKILNSPTNVPQKGDVVFWKMYPFLTGPAGHVAIFSEGNANTFISFDQNYPTRSACHFQKHSYKGVLGWLRKS